MFHASSGIVIGVPRRTPDATSNSVTERSPPLVAMIDPSVVPYTLCTYPRLPPNERIGVSESRSYWVSSPPSELT